MTIIDNPELTDTIIECQNLTIYRDFHEVLHNASCSIPKNSLTFIVGENGSGKTTLVQSILGLLPIHEGEMKLHSDPEKDLIFGYVPQSVNFSKHVQMTVSEYLKLHQSNDSQVLRSLAPKIALSR